MPGLVLAACLESAAPLRYVDLMSGGKPHLLTGVRNNLGAETRISYAPSTRFYVADEVAGRPWVTRLPFPVQVVERVETYDWIGRSRFVTRYAYHHGYFDGHEREFRGFGRVEQWDTEELRQDTAFPDAEAANWDRVLDAAGNDPHLVPHRRLRGSRRRRRHLAEGVLDRTGAARTRPGGRGRGDAAADTVLPDGLDAGEEREAYRALKGQVLRTEVYADDASAVAGNPYSVTEHNSPSAAAAPGPEPARRLLRPSPRDADPRLRAGAADPRVSHEMILETDAYGNVLRCVSVGYPRRAGYPPPEPALTAAVQAMLGLRPDPPARPGNPERLHQRRGRPGGMSRRAPRAAGRGPSTRPKSPAHPAGPRGRDHEPVHVRATSTGPAGLADGVALGRRHRLRADPASDIDGTGAPAAAPARRFVARQRVRTAATT